MMGLARDLLAHGSGLDDLLIAGAIVVAFILIARRGRVRREREARATRDAHAGTIAGDGRSGRSAEPTTCLYCGDPVADTDERCGACGYLR